MTTRRMDHPPTNSNPTDDRRPLIEGAAGSEWVIRVRFEADGIGADDLMMKISEVVGEHYHAVISMGREP